MIKNAIVQLINIYQKLGVIKAKRCRFYPSCSQYSKEAINKYGTLPGIVLGVMRILKCNQFFEGGYDPVK